MSYGSIDEPLILHAAINVPHLGLVFHSSPKATNKQQTQSARSNFEKLVMVRSTDSSLSKQSFYDGDYMVHVLSKSGKMYLCYASKTTKLRVVYNMLDDLDLELAKIPRLANANKNDILKVLKDMVNYYNDPQNDKITKLQQQIDINISKMIENLDKILANRDQFDHLITQTEDLKENAGLFEKGGKKLKRNMQFRMILIITIITIICLVVLGIAILLIALKIAGKI
ncbi:hypothetical protein C9374_012730 [Naegleria lovaniensis]|uniref:Synaptobrevin n=1 Tax=Naegleria lovaniensis TaxID=51637 RepID=A0AA88GWU2_NAELO|nr:uncharacterized protein C9374_012730 [Naegleria lovaniensis]KAG2392478.1 hypothetical protein C9374_012730 [Naegleria lovaniensis]